MFHFLTYNGFLPFDTLFDEYERLARPGRKCAWVHVWSDAWKWLVATSFWHTPSSWSHTCNRNYCKFYEHFCVALAFMYLFLAMLVNWYFRTALPHVFGTVDHGTLSFLHVVIRCIHAYLWKYKCSTSHACNSEVMNFETCIGHANYVMFGACKQKQRVHCQVTIVVTCQLHCKELMLIKFPKAKNSGTICEILDWKNFVEYTDI